MVLAAAYATRGSCPASMLKMRVHGFMAGGVTLFQVAPPSRVTWIWPSSVPAQIVVGDTGLALSAVMLPIGPGLTVVAYLPAFFGTSQVCRVRSGEMRVQECPWSMLL